MNFVIKINNKTIDDKNKLYKEMISKQIQVNNVNKLSTQDMQRITKNLNISILIITNVLFGKDI